MNNRKLIENLDKGLASIKEDTEGGFGNRLEVVLRKSLSEEQLAAAEYLKRSNKILSKGFELHKEGKIDDEQYKVFVKIGNQIADIAKEEQAHIGEFEAMLDLIKVDREPEIEGKGEVNEQ